MNLAIEEGLAVFLLAVAYDILLGEPQFASILWSGSAN